MVERHDSARPRHMSRDHRVVLANNNGSPWMGHEAFASGDLDSPFFDQLGGLAAAVRRSPLSHPLVDAERLEEDTHTRSLLPGPLLEKSETDNRWYVRLELGSEQIADLWVRNETRRDIVVWSKGVEAWVPLLAVSSLRDAIAEAHENVQRESTLPPQPESGKQSTRAAGVRTTQRLPSFPPPARLPSLDTDLIPPGPAHSIAAFGATALPPPRLPDGGSDGVPPGLRLVQSSRPAPLNRAPRAVRFESSLPPPMVPPALKAVSTMAPVASDTPLPEIPPPARLPSDTVPAPPLFAPSITGAPPAPGRPGVGNAERVVWMVAGISVAVAGMLMQKGHSTEVASRPTATLTAQPAVRIADPAPPPAAAVVPVASAVTSPASSNPSVESLPVATASDRTAVASSEKGLARSRTQSAKLAASKPMSDAKLQASGFDTGAARRALASAALRARQCTEAPASGTALITFRPTGFVQSAQILGLVGEGVRRGCVRSAFQEAQVPQFVGSPVTVSKSFRLR